VGSESIEGTGFNFANLLGGGAEKVEEGDKEKEYDQEVIIRA